MIVDIDTWWAENKPLFDRIDALKQETKLLEEEYNEMNIYCENLEKEKLI
jgi:hypothetical protein